MRKKVVSFVLALVMVLALLPTAAFAAGEDGASTLTPLADPTDLKWDTKKPGRCTWVTDGSFQNELYFKIYKEGTQTPVFQTTQYYDGNAPSNFSVDHFARMCAGEDSGSWESGSYYFTVQNHGDGIQYSDSNIVSSQSFDGGIYAYTKPDNALPAPQNGTWEWPAATWTVPDGTDTAKIESYWVDYGFSETEVNGNYNGITIIGGTTMIKPGASDMWLQNKLIGENGNGYYYFRVRARSSNIEEIQNGGFSSWSGAYDLKTASQKITNALTDLNSSATEANVKEEVQKLNKVELENAMRTDLKGGNGTITALAALEEMVGGPAKVAVSADMTSSFAQDGISVVGAALNNTAGTGDITLNVGHAEEEHIRDEMYDSTVAVNFSMTLDNVANPQQLNVPVKITLPIPATINPEFLVILHYHTNGSYEEVHTYCFEDNGKWFASFVLTSFSDFVMTQLAGADPVDPPDSAEYTISVNKAENGTVTTSATNAAAGTEVTITVTPSANFTAEPPVVTGPSGSVAVSKVDDATYKFNMPAGNVTISAAFTAVTPSTYTVTLPSGSTKGSVTADVTAASAGDTVTLTVAPAANFTAAAPVVAGISGTAVAVTPGSGNTYTFTMPAENVTVSVSFTSTLTLKYTPYASMTDADKQEYYGGKLEISGLTTGSKYVVTFDNGLALPSNGKIPRTAHVVTAGADGKVALSCQSGMNVMVFGVSVANGNVNTDLVELYSNNHEGVPVSSLVSGSGT